MADCERCGHPFEPHRFESDFTAPEFTHGIEVPVAGWIVCQDEDCVCWSTWSINHPELPPALVAKIDQYLAELRREYERVGDEIAMDRYEEGLENDEPWALYVHQFRRRRGHA